MDPTHGQIPARALLEQASFLRRLAARLVADPQGADDLVQDTLVAALEHPPRPGPLRGWLATVARRLAQNEQRGARRRGRREQEAARAERLDPDGLSLERIEVQRLLLDELLFLPGEQRTVLYLRYYEDLTPTDIASRLGVPLKTVKTRHTRAVAALRARLDARSGGDRRAWVSALLPLALPRGLPPLDARPPGRAIDWGGAGTAFLGGMAMKKWVLGALLALLLALGLGLRGPLLERLNAARGGPRTYVQLLETPPAPQATVLVGVEAPTTRAPVESLAQEVATGALDLHLSWPDGTPAAELGIEALASNDPAPREEPLRSVTSASGDVRFEGLPAGQLRIHVDGRMFPDGYSFLETEITAGETRTLSATLAEGASVAGRVLDSAGAPVAGAQLWCDDLRGWGPDERLMGRSAADGSFRLRDLGFRNELGARAPGHLAAPGRAPGELPLGADGWRQVELILGAAGGRVQGIVLDPEGRPLAGARVCGGPRGGHSLTLPSGEGATAPEPATVFSDATGAFELPGDLELGTQPLYAQARGFPTWQGQVEVVQGQTTSVEIRLEPGARVEGRLVDAAGQPVGGVKVRAAEEDRGGWYWYPFPVSEDTTDGQGWFVLDWLTPGQTELNASDPQRPELGRARASVTCAGGTTTTCELVLDPGLTIAGRVLDELGRPLAGWRVSSETTGITSWYPRSARTDELGRFRLCNLGDCSHDLSVYAPGLGYPRAELAAVPVGSEGLELVVTGSDARPGTLRGRLLEAGGGPLDGYNLTLWQEGGNQGHFLGFDGSSGVFEQQTLPGRYQLRAAQGLKTLATSPVFEVFEDQETDVGELRIEAQGSLELVVRGPSPAELERLSPALDRPGYSTVDLTLVDGAFRAPSLSPGTWTLSTNSKGWFLPTAIEVLSGEATTLVLDAQRTLCIELQLTRADGGLLGEVHLEAHRPDGTLLKRGRRSYSEPRPELRWQVFLPPGPVRLELGCEGLSAAAELTPEGPLTPLPLVLDRP